MICKSIDILEKNFKHISTIVLDDIGNKIEEITYNKESIIEVIKDIKSYFLLRKCEYCSWLINEVCTNDKSPLCSDFPPRDYGCVYCEQKTESLKKR